MKSTLHSNLIDVLFRLTGFCTPALAIPATAGIRERTGSLRLPLGLGNRGKPGTIILLLLLTCLILAPAVRPAAAAEVSLGEAVTTESDLKVEMSAPSSADATVFGHNLFKGSFTAKSQPHYNPNYRIAIGDTINLRIWGSFEFTADVKVDSQGNIFIPKVGIVAVGGATNQRLVKIIEAKVYKMFNQRIFVYANVADFQPVWVFVTGNVNQPGLYQGMASDSVIQFIDKAKGINVDYGSFRDIRIVRNNQVAKKIDLYKFLTDGKLDLFQFHDGDSIVVGDIQYRITAAGDVKRPFMFEFPTPDVALKNLLDLAIPNPTATNLTLTHWSADNKKETTSYTLSESEHLTVRSGDAVEIYADHYSDANTITITGEHQGPHTLVLPENYTLAELMCKLMTTDLSDVSAIQLFRKSVAEKQKQLLLAKLHELESLVLTTSSVSKDEALMRSQEAKSILTFIDRAKKVEPKGQVVIHDKAGFNEIYLEEGDQIFIPRKTNIVLVQGEVAFPGAHTFIKGNNVEDYILLAGDFSQRANKDRVLVIKQNGRVAKCKSHSKLDDISIDRGDSVLVLPKLEGKNIQITKDITQILYQIAVGAGVILAL
jgi:protein involved in polysaccharide export with SLBB domain